MTDIEKKLKNDFSYCSCAEISKATEVTPEYINGFNVTCNLYEHPLYTKEDCLNCSIYKLQNK